MVKKYLHIVIGSTVLFTIAFGQNTKKLPDNIYASIRFVVAVPPGEFFDNVTK